MRNLLTAGCLLACVGSASIAAAQETGTGTANLDIRPYNIAIRAGVAYPTGGGLRHVASPFVAVGAEYTFDKVYLPNTATYFSVDWFGKTTSGAHGNIFPICINERLYLGKPNGDSQQFYIFGGVGAFILDLTSSETVLGGRAGVGYNLGQHVYGEATFTTSSKGSGGADATALGVYLGYRF